MVLTAYNLHLLAFLRHIPDSPTDRTAWRWTEN